MTIRVLICDDQSLVRAGITKLLEADPELHVVGQAADGTEAVRRTRATSPEVVLMDVRMPKMDGITATRHIVNAQNHHTKILILTTFGEEDYVFQALQAGASGFLLKDAPPETLLTAIRVIARGDSLLDPAVTRSVVAGFVRSGSHRPLRTTETHRLTRRELETLQLIAAGCSNAEIAHHLVLSEATVKTHVGNVLTKLNVRDRVHAVIFAYQNGLTNPPDRR